MSWLTCSLCRKGIEHTGDCGVSSVKCDDCGAPQPSDVRRLTRLERLGLLLSPLLFTIPAWHFLLHALSRALGWPCP